MRDATREGAGVEAGRRSHGEDVAGDHVEHDDRTALMLLHLLGCEALQVEVDGEQRVRARLALGAVEFTHDAADRVDLDLDGAGAATQVVLERALNALLAEPHRRKLQHRFVSAGEVLVGDTSGVAHDVAHQLAFGIVPRLAEVDEHARQIGRIEFNAGHFLPAEIFTHHHRLRVAAAPEFAQQAGLLGLSQGEDLVEALDQYVGAAAAIRSRHGAEVVAVDGQRLTAAVENQAA